MNLEKESDRLKSTINELSILNDIALAITSTQSVEKILDQITQKCIKHLEAEEGTVNLLQTTGSDQKFQTMIRKQDVSKIRLPFRLDNQLTGWMLRNKKPIIINDLKNDEEFNKFMLEEIPFSNLLGVPMMVKGKLIGLIALFNKKFDSGFTQEDQRLLSIIASQSAQIIENARLYEEEKALLHLKEEMKMARSIQENLLPKKIPEIEGFDIAVQNISAKEVGGDYYDFMEMDENTLGFCVGDITGKGMPAALLMANLQATLRSQSIVQSDISKCLSITNKLLYKSTDPGRFATLFLGKIYPQKNIIEYSNGGHDSPIHLKNNGEYEMLETTGLLLGCFDDAEYDYKQIKLNKNELLIIFSDGITEAMNKEEEEFGLDKLIETAKILINSSAEEILTKIIEKVKSHALGTEQSDDITLMVIKKI